MFQHFLETPPEIRTIFIDKMEPDDRCRFTGSSKLCNKEGKASKNYIYGVLINCYTDCLYINILQGNDAQSCDKHGFALNFVRRPTRSFMSCAKLDCKKLWKIEFDNSTDIIQLGIKEAKKYLKLYQNTIKRLTIREPDWTENPKNLKDVDFEIDSLKNLEDLQLCGDINFRQIFSKLRKPLKRLVVDGELGKLLIDCEQMYQVQNHLTWWNVELNEQQFSELSAKNLTMQIGKLSETDIFNFIRCWQNGTIGKEIEVYRWYWDDSNFNKEQLLRLLRIKNDGSGEYEVKHYKEAGKIAMLTFSEFHMVFST